MTNRSRAVLLGALALLAVAAVTSPAVAEEPYQPYVEPVEGLPMWYFAAYAIIDYSSAPGPFSPPTEPIAIDPFNPQPQAATPGGTGLRLSGGASAVYSSVAFPATLGRMPSRPGGKALRRDLTEVQNALGF